MSNAHNRKTEFVIAGTINPNYLQVLETTCSGRKLQFIHATAEDGTCDFEKLNDSLLCTCK